MSGHLALSRAVFDDPRLPTLHHQAAWIVLLLHARWPEGAIAGTWADLASGLGWNEFSTKRCVRFFESQGMIDLDADGYRYRLRILDASHVDLGHSSGNGTGSVVPNCYRGQGKPVFGSAREAIPTSVRKAVLERDGEICAYCATTDGPFEIDHIVPVALGGGNGIANLTVACLPCNRSKGAQPLKKWMGA